VSLAHLRIRPRASIFSKLAHGAQLPGRLPTGHKGFCKNAAYFQLAYLSLMSRGLCLCRRYAAFLQNAGWSLDISSQKGAFQPAPQRGAAYQPRVQPWVDVASHSGVLKERRIDIDYTHVLRPDTNHSLGHMRRSFRTLGRFRQGSQGVALGYRCPFGTRGMFKIQRGIKLALRVWI
jgi:hypothetical protein